MPDQLTWLPRFTWHSNNKSTVRFQTATSQVESEVLVVVLSAIWGQKNGTLRYIHSQCSLLPSLTLEHSWFHPPQAGLFFYFLFFSHPTRLTRLNILVSGLNRTDGRNATWTGFAVCPLEMIHTHFLKEGDVGSAQGFHLTSAICVLALFTPTTNRF